MKPKMLYSGSKKYLTSKLEGVEQYQVQANDYADLEWENMVALCKKFEK